MANTILKEGFKDGSGSYGTGLVFSGVWFSNYPLDINEGAKGDTLLSVDIPEFKVLQYEWQEEGKTYREFLIPASLVNDYAVSTIQRDSEPVSRFMSG